MVPSCGPERVRSCLSPPFQACLVSLGLGVEDGKGEPWYGGLLHVSGRAKLVRRVPTYRAVVLAEPSPQVEESNSPLLGLTS